MKTFRFLFVSLLIVSVFLLQGCFVTDLVKGGPVAVIPEMVISPEASMVFTFDHSDKTQIAFEDAILNKFSTIKIPQNIITQYNQNAPKQLSYENLKDLFSGEYKISIGIKLPEKLDSAVLNQVDADFDLSKISGLDAVIAGTFSDTKKVETLINESFKSKGVVPVEENGYKTWTVLNPTIYIVEKDNLFFVTGTKENRDAAMDRLEKGTGLDKAEILTTSLTNLSEKNLGYVYLDLNKIENLFSTEAGAMAKKVLLSSEVGLYRSVFSVFVAENEGIKIISRIGLKNDTQLLNKYLPPNEISLVNKVPGENLIMYAEMPPVLSTMLEDLSGTVSESIGAVPPADVKDAVVSDTPDAVVVDTGVKDVVVSDAPPLPTDVAAVDNSGKLVRTDAVPQPKISRLKPPKKEFPKSTLVLPSSEGSEEVKKEEAVVTDCGPDKTDCSPSPLSFNKPKELQTLNLNELAASGNVYESFLAQVSGITEVSKDDLKGILASPYAIAFYDTGTLVPGVAVYFKVADKYAESAKKLMAVVSTYMDQVILQLDDQLKAQSGTSGMIKKDTKIISGAGIQKIYVDWSKIPKEVLKSGSLKTKMDLSNTKVEFYYGIFSDNVMTFALYPDFADSYGKKVVADMPYFNEAKLAVKTVYGYKLSFLKVDNFLGLGLRYLGAFGSGFIPKDSVDKAYGVLKDLTKIEYVFSSTSKEGQNFLKSITYIKIGDKARDMKIEIQPAVEEEIVKPPSTDTQEKVETAESVSVGPDKVKIDGAKNIAALIKKNITVNLSGGGCVFKDKALGPISEVVKANTDDFKAIAIDWLVVKKTAILGTICEGGYTVLVDKGGKKYGVFIKLEDEKNGNMSCSDVSLGADSTKLVDLSTLALKKEGACYGVVME